MAKKAKNTKRNLKKKVSKPFIINCDTDAEVLLPFFTNVVSILNAQIEATKSAKPRRKTPQNRLMENLEMPEDSASIADEEVAPPKRRRVRRNNINKGLKLVQKSDRRQSIAPYPKRKSLLPYFNIATSVMTLPAVPLPDTVPAAAAVPASNATHDSTTAFPPPSATNLNQVPIPNGNGDEHGNEQPEASSRDIFHVMRNNMNVICNGEFIPQDAGSESTQTDPQSDNPTSSDVNIFDCLSDRLCNGWNNRTLR